MGVPWELVGCKHRVSFLPIEKRRRSGRSFGKGCIQKMEARGKRYWWHHMHHCVPGCEVNNLIIYSLLISHSFRFIRLTIKPATLSPFDNYFEGKTCSKISASVKVEVDTLHSSSLFLVLLSYSALFFYLRLGLLLALGFSSSSMFGTDDDLAS